MTPLLAALLIALVLAIAWALVNFIAYKRKPKTYLRAEGMGYAIPAPRPPWWRRFLARTLFARYKREADAEDRYEGDDA